MPLVHVRVQVSLEAELPDTALGVEDGLGPAELARQLAAALLSRSAEDQLGYVPALDYLRGQAEWQGWLELHEVYASRARSLARQGLLGRAGHAYTQCRLLRVVNPAQALPRVRPDEPAALKDLARHLSPGQVRIDLEVSAFEKREKTRVEQDYARHLAGALHGVARRVRVVTARRIIEPGG